ncbi:hypothetical protein HRR95_008356 [Exophiala dermatitidis]|nr:hypothetical protein HRR75_005459 [Exophiala dermatitidis]KAJ4549644.1 hypothetical protein HRR78_005103 [Exophiala dermatitidis]KAJ4666254.1 hypothetical protein HRR95_008356 [Exophiala dermatitidis]
MPPMRTTPPAKAIKTERTHEENQERYSYNSTCLFFHHADLVVSARAYIAASRRSDRSLEARVESARRASEIHKRRTGRSLRVTEQDVINEEMYEEEDDDLPLQYRRLTAHLQTGSADFNRRLAAYLTNQVAMRSAMEQMMANGYAHYPSQSGFATATAPSSSRPNMFPSPMLSHPNMSSMVPPSGAGGSYRTAPYPSPHQPNFRSGHGRAFSMASIPTHDLNNQGRQSPPSANSSSSADPQQAPSLDHHRRMSTPGSIPRMGESQQQQQQQQIDTTDSGSGIKAEPEYLRQAQLSPPLSHAGGGGAGGGGLVFSSPWQDQLGGFTTTSLPPEAQQMLAHAPGLDPSDPSYAMLMHGSDQYISNNRYYPWHGNGHDNSGNPLKGMPVHDHTSAYQATGFGMSATLAPSVLEQQNPNGSSTTRNDSHSSTSSGAESTPTTTTNLTHGKSSISAASDATTTTSLSLSLPLPTAGLDFNFSQETMALSKGLEFGAGSGAGVGGMSAVTSGQITPAAEGFWDHFVMDGSWDDGGDIEVDVGGGSGGEGEGV